MGHTQPRVGPNELSQNCLEEHGYGFIYRGTDNLPVAIILKKMSLPLTSDSPQILREGRGLLSTSQKEEFLFTREYSHTIYDLLLLSLPFVPSPQGSVWNLLILASLLMLSRWSVL